jgi:hypothetical protein
MKPCSFAKEGLLQLRWYDALSRMMRARITFEAGMNDEYKPIVSRSGVFGSYSVYGTLYQDRERRSPAKVWLITFVEEGSPGSSDYWVSENEIREVQSGNLFASRTPLTHEFTIGAVVEDLLPAKKEAIALAITNWESKAEGS